MNIPMRPGAAEIRALRDNHVKEHGFDIGLIDAGRKANEKWKTDVLFALVGAVEDPAVNTRDILKELIQFLHQERIHG